VKLFHVKQFGEKIMESVIEVENLVHNYGSRRAVNGLSFTAYRGEVLGLLGPNGAGKTTTVRLCNGIFIPTSGNIHVLGLDPAVQGDAVRRQTGVLTETPALYERLTARQNLDFFGTLAGMSPSEIEHRSAELLDFFDLQDRASERVGVYSKGMKQRLALARALLHNPPLLFLDEPTSGLDPEAAQQVHDLITNVRSRNGQTVLLATHNLFEAQRLCDRVAVMNHGRLLALGTLDELRRQIAPGLWINVDLLSPLPAERFAVLASLPGVLASQPENDHNFRLQVAEMAAVPPLVAALVGWKAQILSIQPREVPLEEIYFRLQEQYKEEA
jgi:ABC-2 type transport system ATP-binding protein